MAYKYVRVHPLLGHAQNTIYARPDRKYVLNISQTEISSA